MTDDDNEKKTGKLNVKKFLESQFEQTNNVLIKGGGRFDSEQTFNLNMIACDRHILSFHE